MNYDWYDQLPHQLDKLTPGFCRRVAAFFAYVSDEDLVEWYRDLEISKRTHPQDCVQVAIRREIRSRGLNV